MFVLIAASVGPRFSDTYLSSDGSCELAVKLNRFSEKAGQSTHKEQSFLPSKSFQGPGLPSERVQDSAIVGQADRPTKGQGNIIVPYIFSF